MRIRNRSMQFPFSFSPPPQTPSDQPHHDKQQQDQECPPTIPKETRTERHPMAHHSKDRSDGSNSIEMINKECCMASSPISKPVKAMEEKDGKEDDGRLSAKHKGILWLQSKYENLSFEDAQTTASISFSSTADRWKEGERAFPLKKRKGSFQWGILEDIPSDKEKKNNNKNNKIKTNKRLDKGICISCNVERNKKRKFTAGVAMEGSRCSRVNGRGWRCSQQTLVGYSLCEHHLGKGRLRSMASVRKGTSFLVIEPTTNVGEDKGQLLSPKKPKEASIEEKEEEEEEEEEEEKIMLLVKNNKKKIRVVKARSISSLLDHAHHATMA